MSGGLGLSSIDTKNKVLRCPRDHSIMDEIQKRSVREISHGQRTEPGEQLENVAFVDVCNKCGGMFFDQGEMFAAFGLKADPSYWDRPETGGVMKESPLHCSRCEGHMLAQDVTKGGVHVEIDRCAHCGGIWLDEGEIEKIQAVSEHTQAGVDAEREKARAELARMGDDPLGTSTDLIANFLNIFRVGKKKK